MSVNVCVGPRQVIPPIVYSGKTVNVATIGVVPGLLAIKEAIFPFPETGRPMVGLLFVQLYDVPVPTKETIWVGTLLQITTSAGSTTPGVGLTLIVILWVKPLHVSPACAYSGVTRMVPVTREELVFVAVNAPIFPVPFATNPMEVVLFVHV